MHRTHCNSRKYTHTYDSIPLAHTRTLERNTNKRPSIHSIRNTWPLLSRVFYFIWFILFGSSFFLYFLSVSRALTHSSTIHFVVHLFSLQFLAIEYFAPFNYRKLELFFLILRFCSGKKRKMLLFFHFHSSVVVVMVEVIAESCRCPQFTSLNFSSGFYTHNSESSAHSMMTMTIERLLQNLARERAKGTKRNVKIKYVETVGTTW